MPERKAIISYPGAPSIMQAEYTLSHGIQPGLIVLTCNPRFEDLAMVGDLILSDSVNTVTVPTCRVERADITFDTGQFVVSLRLFDRRWMWRYQEISGHYNLPVPRVHDLPSIDRTNKVIAGPTMPAGQQPPPAVQTKWKKDARQLAELCLKAMGEKIYDVSKIPNNDHPEVFWDHANPAEQLQMLCTQYGLRVVYRPDTDSVICAKLGEGAPLPEPANGESASQSLTIDPPEAPKMIVVYGDAIRYQVRFELEPVGLDFDGQVKPIDDLSYKPGGGWTSFQGPFTFATSAGTFAQPLPTGWTYLDAKHYADESVYRWYRIKNTYPKDKPDPSVPTATNSTEFWIPVGSTDFKDKFPRDQIELLPHLAEATQDGFDNRILIPALCYGVAETGGINYAQTIPGTRLNVPFEIDPARQIVKFSRFMRRLESTSVFGGAIVRYYPATLILECCCHVREKTTNNIRRYRYEYPLQRTPKSKRPPTDVLAIIRDDVKFWMRAQYHDAIDNKLHEITSNREACEKQAKYYAESEAMKFVVQAPSERRYNAVKPIYCDGAIQSVSWSVGISGIITVASRDAESASVVQPYAVQQRQLEVSLARKLAFGPQREPAINKAIAKDFGA